jgi:hypothetical protein
MERTDRWFNRNFRYIRYIRYDVFVRHNITAACDKICESELIFHPRRYAAGNFYAVF